MSKKSNHKAEQAKHFPIVAIGASAGGIEAAIELFQHLPANTGMAYVYIQHLDRDHPSRLSEIIGRSTDMPVVEAENLQILQSDHVYIIPPNKEMALIDGSISVTPRGPEKGVQMSINNFFISLAERHKEAAIGVILSGMFNDGTTGLKAIKRAGGITFAQDESAQYQSMSKSAVFEGVVDKVLSPKEIASELERLGKQADVLQATVREEGNTLIEDGDENLQIIIQLLKKTTGVDFTHYKLSTIKRRIIRRMLLYKLDALKDYVQYLRQHTNEASLLYQDLLINVTYFFRDPDTMEYLEKTLIPRILKNKAPNDLLRIWIPACATGEEAYSLAMVFLDVLGEKITNTALQIFATDLSEPTIAKARLGIYSQSDVNGIPPKKLQRYFTKVDGSYRIMKSIRDLCVFAPHNVFKDPPFSRIDLISCCNLLIYLDSVLQKKLFNTFHYSLNENGFLVIGKSESIGSSTQQFAQLEKKYKIYARKGEAQGSSAFEMNYRLPQIRTDAAPVYFPANKVMDNAADLERIVDNLLLDKYVPASVVVNGDLDILQFRGSTGLYLEPAPGKASLNLLKMARPGLAFELRRVIHKASKTRQIERRSGLEVKQNNTSYLVSIEVVPLKSNTEDKLFLVVFNQVIVPDIEELKGSLSRGKLVKQLEEELKTAKEDMRSIIEEQEASNEELQSANEEIVSANEELQSINEELETSKEELESTNEELMTINVELQMRNEQLAEAYEYAEAVFGTIREAILVLSKDFRIKSANPSFFKIFGMKEQDIENVLIYELGRRQWDIPALRHMLEVILTKQDQYEGLEIRQTFPVVGEKVLLLNACRITQKIHRQQLTLLAIEDISDLRKSEQENGKK